jgi:hypothetical protein
MAEELKSSFTSAKGSEMCARSERPGASVSEAVAAPSAGQNCRS